MSVATYAYDTFNRTVTATGGWGYPENPSYRRWVPVPFFTGGTFSVTPGNGRISAFPMNTTTRVIENQNLNTARYDMEFTNWWGGRGIGIILRASASTSTIYSDWIGAVVHVTQNSRAEVLGFSVRRFGTEDGDTGTYLSHDYPERFQSNIRYRLAAEITSEELELVRMKLWQADQPEPDWQYVGTYPGIRTQTGNYGVVFLSGINNSELHVHSFRAWNGFVPDEFAGAVDLSFSPGLGTDGVPDLASPVALEATPSLPEQGDLELSGSAPITGAVDLSQLGSAAFQGGTDLALSSAVGIDHAPEFERPVDLQADVAIGDEVLPLAVKQDLPLNVRADFKKSAFFEVEDYVFGTAHQSRMKTALPRGSNLAFGSADFG